MTFTSATIKLRKKEKKRKNKERETIKHQNPVNAEIRTETSSDFSTKLDIFEKIISNGLG